MSKKIHVQRAVSPIYLIGFFLLLVTSVDSQTENPQAASGVAAHGVTFSDPIETEWEFGMKIDSTGNTLGIKAAIPVPMDWPEQEIEMVVEQKSDNLGKFNFKNNTKYAKQMSFSIRRMGPGQSETAFIRIKVKKRMILAPVDPSQFVKAEKVPTEFKTFLKPSPYIESKESRIRDIADSLQDDSLSAWEQVEKIYRWVRENVEYKFDPQIHTCLDALDAKTGDCEELSSIFIAICRAQGIPARAVWIPDHTYPEFYLHDKEGNGHWFPCQAAGNYEFGAMTDTKPILQKGDRFKIDGERKPVRYLRPTLVARTGGASISWINRQVQGAPSTGSAPSGSK